MANLIRTAKSGSDWTQNELDAYNIVVTSSKEVEFFGKKLGAIPSGLSEEFLEYTFSSEMELPDESDLLLGYLDLASRTLRGQESAVDDFARELLRSTGFESSRRIIRNRNNIPLVISGEYKNAQTDVCIMRRKDQILLLLQEDKRLTSFKDPEPLVIAEAIAAFQENNKIRRQSGIKELDEMVFPCITMIGTFPMFYLVPVTKELSYCIRNSLYPESVTDVLYHVPKVPRRTSEGMKPVENRRKILQCFEAFKKFVDELEECLKVVD